MKPLVAAVVILVALAVGAQAQTPEAAKARKTAELRKAAELGWAVMRALRNLPWLSAHEAVDGRRLAAV